MADTPCHLCKDGNIYHHFQRIGKLSDKTTQIFYTNPALATCYMKYDETSTKGKREEDQTPVLWMRHFQETNNAPWIWIINCQTTTSFHLMNFKTTRVLMKLFYNKHKDTLKAIYLIQPSMVVRTFLTLIYPFVLSTDMKKFHICSDGLLDSRLKLAAAGIPTAELNTLTLCLQ